MRINGDIKVWTDGEKACARLHADGPEGPIVVHASAPLEPIRRRVARQFARRGVAVEGNDAAFKATVRRIGRRKALKRLQKMVPRAFRPGGLAPYLARQELRRRRRRRKGLARAGLPVGQKALGRILGVKKAVSRALAPVLPASAAALAPPANVPGPTAPAASDPAPELAEGDEDAAVEEAGEPFEDSDDAQAVVTDEGGEPGGEELSGDAALAVWRDERARVLLNERLRAALRLLAAARRDPRARQRVRYIVTLAGEGNPKARKALAVLAKAKKVVTKKLLRRSAPKAALVPRAPAPPARRRAAAPLVARAAPGKPPRWWDLFATWRRGMG